jgi:lysozyme family protein
MSEWFEKAFAQVVGIEGRYVNDPADSGGATKYGITEAVARRHGYQGPMAALPLATAQAIYRADYWEAMNLDAVAGISGPVALELFEQGVNMGIAQAGKHFQRALNVLNGQSVYYPDVLVDGKIGGGTLRAFDRYGEKRKADGATAFRVFVSILNSLQGAFYVDLAERRSKDERFVYGWFANRVA